MAITIKPEYHSIVPAKLISGQVPENIARGHADRKRDEGYRVIVKEAVPGLFNVLVTGKMPSRFPPGILAEKEAVKWFRLKG